MRSGAAHYLARLGLAFAFLFPPLSALFDPFSWMSYFPRFVRGIVPDLLLLHAFGLVEVIIALWILSGRKIFVPCIAAAALLLAIVVFNLNDFDILFRDVALALFALSLAVAERPRRA